MTITGIWQDRFARCDFTFEERRAILIRPDEGMSNGKWLLKTEYFYAFPELEAAMVAEGYHLAYLENRNRWGTDDDLAAKRRFRDFLMRECGLDPRCVLVGMSCGGLHAVKQAARYPEMVSAMYLDAPVLNILSCPFGMGAGCDCDDSVREEALSALGLTRSQLLAYRDHPLDNLGRLVAARIPALLVCGDADMSVPPEENGLLLKAAYEQAGVPLMFMLKPGCGHHPHGPSDMAKALEFLRAW